MNFISKVLGNTSLGKKEDLKNHLGFSVLWIISFGMSFLLEKWSNLLDDEEVQ